MDQNDRHYRIDEGTIMLPAGFEDRTANIFAQADVEHPTLNLNIARDRLRPGETLDKYVTRQLGVMKDKLPGYKAIDRAPGKLGTGVSTIDGEQVDASYKNGNRIIYQRQAAFPLEADRVLIFSATSASPFSEHSNALWASWLSSFIPRSTADDAPAP